MNKSIKIYREITLIYICINKHKNIINQIQLKKHPKINQTKNPSNTAKKNIITVIVIIYA